MKTTTTIIFVLLTYSATAQTTFGPQQVITTSADAAHSIFATDLDGDGDADVLSASGSKVAWYANLGSGTFGPEELISTAVNAAQSVYATDLDGDGDEDVLSASASDDKIAWYENLGSGSFGSQQVITTNADLAYSVYAVDLDGDGDADVLSASVYDDKIAWYENLGSGSFGPQQVITTSADYANTVYATDLDNDGDADVLGTSLSGSKVLWYENLGGSFGPEQIITTLAGGAESVHAKDLDGDGDADVLSASDDIIAWYENLGSGLFGPQQVITNVADLASSVYATDLDGDGDADVLSASLYDDKIAWYENLGSGTFSSQQIITTDADGALSVYATDLDGDGDADVLSASLIDDKIAWYENLLPPSVALCTTPATTLSQLEASVEQYNDVILADEAGFVVSGTSPGGTGMVTQRLDCTGAVLWTNTATASGSVNLNSSALDRGDGTYWVAGALSPSSSTFPDGTILTIDAATGAELDRLQLGGTAPDGFASIAATTDSGAIVAGTWASFGQEDAWLVKLDASGDTAWTRIVDAGQDEKYNDAVESAGFLYAAGQRKFSIVGGSITQGLIAKYDLAGNELWRKNGLDSVSWFDMAAQPGGGFVAVGQKNISTTERRMALAAYDASSNLLWQKEYGQPGQASWGGSIEAIVGGYIIAGRRNATASTSEGWLLTIDLAGNLLEEKQIEDFVGQQNTFTEVVPMPDGERYAAVGFGGDPLASQGWFWLGRFGCEITGYDPMPDTLSFCNQDSVLLDAGVGFTSYLWSTGESTNSIYVSSPRSYSVLVTDSADCQALDSAWVNLVNVSIVQSDTSICEGDSLVLFVADEFGSVANQNALFFDGVDDFVDGSASPAMDVTSTNQLTIAAWIRPDDVIPQQRVFTHTGASSTVSQQYALLVSAGGIYFISDAGVFEPPFNLTGPILSDSVWSHIAVTYDNAAVRLYLNGILEFENFVVESFPNAPIGRFRIGSRTDGAEPFKGAIDDVQVWSRALSESEIRQFSKWPPPLEDGDVLAFWNFEEGKGSTLMDVSDNANIGTLQGAIWVNDDPQPQSSTIVWSTGDTSSTISVRPISNSTYTVAVSDGITICTDTIRITVESSTVTFSSCPEDIIASSSSPVFWTEPTAANNCYGAVTVVQIAGLPSGSIFPTGITAVSYTAADSTGQTDTCSFTVTVDEPCPIPTALISFPASNGVILSWFDDPEHLGVQIKGRRLGDTFFGTAQTGASSFAIGGLTPSTSYEWRLRAKCLDGDISGFSPLDTFSTLSLKEQARTQQLFMHPNPASNVVSLSWSGIGEDVSLRVLDIRGREIYSASTSGNSIDQIETANWAPGVYFVKVIGTEGILTDQLIVE